MSYLLDKKIQRKKFSRIALGAASLLFLFYFRVGLYDGFSYVAEIIFHPFFVVGNGAGAELKNLGSYFLSKNYLYLQNQELKAELSADDARMANYDSVAADAASLKEILGRKNAKVPMVLAAILAKPNQSLYDTLLIDAGSKEGIKNGDTVFALGDVPIGRVDSVYDNSAKVILFSSPGEKIQAVLSSSKNLPAGRQGTYLELVGRGGGNFEMTMPKDFALAAPDQMVMPGINPYVLAITQTIISDPRDPLSKALLVSPINVQEIKFVQVEI